jgi:hypothetical protein
MTMMVMSVSGIALYIRVKTVVEIGPRIDVVLYPDEYYLV